MEANEAGGWNISTPY